MNKYSLNIAERTGLKHPPYRHYALVVLGDDDKQARIKAAEIASLFRNGSSEGQFKFTLTCTPTVSSTSEDI